MKSALIPALVLALLTGCTSTGTMTGHHDPAKPRSVYIEPFKDYPDYPELRTYADKALSRKGYDAIDQEQQASYRLRSSLTWGFTKIAVAVRLVDTATSQVVYFGECNNPGFGTGIANRKALEACFDSAFDALK